MVYSFNGPYSYDERTVEDWNNSSIGVYYIGQKTPDGRLTIFYIGRSTGREGIRGRLLDHLGEDKWSDATHFGYHFCDTVQETIDWEEKEIFRFKPKYNTVGVFA